MRSAMAGFLIFLGCVLAPLGVLAVWADNEVSDTERYVESVAPLSDDPKVQAAITDRLTSEIMRAVRQRLGDNAAQRIEDPVRTYVARVVASDQFDRAWAEANRSAHRELVRALEGDSSAVGVQNGNVTLDLAVVIDIVKDALAAGGVPFTDRIPELHPTYELFPAAYLQTTQTSYRYLKEFAWVLPIAALVCFALGVAMAVRRLRALAIGCFGLAASMGLLLAGMTLVKEFSLQRIPEHVSPDAAGAAFDALSRFVTDTGRIIALSALAVAVVALLVGLALRPRQGRDPRNVQPWNAY